MDSVVYFKSLSDSTRIRLFHCLLHHELSVNEIVSLLKMGQSRISRHLKILIDAGLLQCRRNGLHAFYSVIDGGPGRKFSEAIRYLFNKDPILNEDLVRAQKIIDDRRLKTMNFFNSIASEWDLLKRDIIGNFDLNEAILKHIDTNWIVVDLGCGTGELLSGIKSITLSAIGVDSSPKMLEETRRRFQGEHQDIDLRLGELEHLPLRNEEADCAVISMVLHHLSNPHTVLNEINRILKPGGSFILVDFDKHNIEDMRHSYGDQWLGFTGEEIEKWLASQNFLLSRKETYKLKKSLQLNLFISTKKNEKENNYVPVRSK